MKDLYNDLHGACDVMSGELGDLMDKIDASNGKMTGAELDELDKLTHGIKSVKTTLAMMDAEEGGSYARRTYGVAGNDGYGSYSRRRDSMGRYTRRAYDDGMDDRR